MVSLGVEFGGAGTKYLHETLCRFSPALEQSSELFMISRYDPFFVRPLFVAEGECGDVESLAKVDWVADSCFACFAVSLHDFENSGSSLPGPHNVTEF